jgi:hypothetical protein
MVRSTTRSSQGRVIIDATRFGAGSTTRLATRKGACARVNRPARPEAVNNLEKKRATAGPAETRRGNRGSCRFCNADRARNQGLSKIFLAQPAANRLNRNNEIPSTVRGVVLQKNLSDRFVRCYTGDKGTWQKLQK